MHLSKKLLSTVLVLVLSFTLLPAVAFANDEVTVTVNGQAVSFADQGPIIVDGRTLVPVAGVFQALGFDTAWNPEDRQVTITRGDDVIIVTIDSSTFVTNNEDHNLDVSAQIIGGRTMLPIAPVLRSVGYYVTWDAENRTVVVTGTAPAAAPAEEAPATEEEPADEPEADDPQADETESEAEEEDESVQESAAQTLEGTWIWLSSPYYVFNADGTGLMLTQDINWWTDDGILSICSTVILCQGDCIAPMQWYYVIEGNQLTLTSTIIEGMYFVYTR